MSCNTDPCPEGRPSPCEVKCPQPIVTSTNEACVVSCGDSRVIIYPPPVIVTFPGPILSTCPQESLVGAAVPCESGVSQSATTVPLTSEIGGNAGFSVPLRSEIGGSSGSSVPLRSEIMGNSGCFAERLYLNREPEQPSTYTYSFTSQWRHPCNRPRWNRYQSSYLKKEEPEEEEKPKEWHIGTEESS